MSPTDTIGASFTPAYLQNPLARLGDTVGGGRCALAAVGSGGM